MQEGTQFYWDPNDWELQVGALLRHRHGPLNVHKVPARHQGDHGIDYYSLKEQVVYQCYAVQEPCDVAARANKQKVKMRTDLKKFCSNRKELKDILGDTKMSHWVLVVPLHDSAEVNMYASEMTEEIRKLGLSYVSPDFEVSVDDLESFDEDAKSWVELQRKTIHIPTVPATNEQVRKWVASENALVAALVRKLNKRVSTESPAEFEELVEEHVRWFLERENSLENLRANSPVLYESLTEVIKRLYLRLRVTGPAPEGSAHYILKQALDELATALKESVPNLSAPSADSLARGTVAEWLMRCPLDFPPYDHAS